VNYPVRPRRNNVFFEQYFDYISYRLQQAKGTSTVGTKADLYPSHTPALNPDKAHHQSQHKNYDDNGKYQPVPPETAWPVGGQALPVLY
jgi:hypothetical protein